MRTMMLFLALVIASVGAFAETVKVDRIDVVSKGIYVIETGTETPEANAPQGKITAVTTVKNVEATTTIPAHLGLEFGLQYIVVGEPSGTEISLDIVIRYPPQGLLNPDDQKSIYESKFQRKKNIGDTVYLGYGFENPWETVPGAWTFQIWYQNRKLVDQSFTVVK